MTGKVGEIENGIIKLEVAVEALREFAESLDGSGNLKLLRIIAFLANSFDAIAEELRRDFDAAAEKHSGPRLVDNGGDAS